MGAKEFKYLVRFAAAMDLAMTVSFENGATVVHMADDCGWGISVKSSECEISWTGFHWHMDGEDDKVSTLRTDCPDLRFGALTRAAEWFVSSRLDVVVQQICDGGFNSWGYDDISATEDFLAGVYERSAWAQAEFTASFDPARSRIDVLGDEKSDYFCGRIELTRDSSGTCRNVAAGWITGLDYFGEMRSHATCDQDFDSTREAADALLAAFAKAKGGSDGR